jgi:type IV secretion system protein VirD4
MSLSSLLKFFGLLSQPIHHGSAGWMDPPSSMYLDTRHGIPEGRFFIGRSSGRDIALSKMEAQRHLLILGGSGTGKSRGYFLPNASWSKNSSMVCTDPKSELWKLTSGKRKFVLRYAPTDPDSSECFNWILLATDARMAELCARAIVSSGNTSQTEQAWLDMETCLLASVFAHTATLTRPTPLSAYHLFTRQPIEDLTATLLESKSEVARDQAMIFSQTTEKLRGTIVPIVASKLQFLLDPKTARFSSSSLDPPDFSSLRQTPISVYWCLREQDIARLRPLTSLFFTILLEQLSAGSESGEGVPVSLLLDEFANIGKIPDFETTISLARGRGVSLVLGIQSLGQLDALYGIANAKTIISNCGTKIALSGLDVDTAEYISRSLGETTTSVRKITRNGFLNPSYGTSKDEHSRRLLTADEVRRIGHDEAIVITSNLRPMRLKKLFYDEPATAAIAPRLGSALVNEVRMKPKDAPPPMPEFKLIPGKGRRHKGRDF